MAATTLPRAALVVVVSGALAAGACGGGDDGTAAPTTVPDDTTTTSAPACTPEVSEPIDPQSARHLVPGAPEPQYQTDPPTSGAHRTSALPRGALREPIPRPQQVGLLEDGAVLIQYRDIPPDDVAALERLVSDEVVVAPNPDLDAAVVATAWTFKQVCQRVDAATLSAFVAAHAGRTGTNH